MRTSFGRIGLHGRAVVAAAAVLAAVSMASCGGCGRGCVDKPEKALRVPLDIPEARTGSELVANFMKTFNHGDLGVAAGMCANDVTWKENGSRLPPSKGRGQVEAILGSMKRSMSDAVLKPRLILDEGELVVVQYSLLGTHDGWLPGSQGDGKRLGAEGLMIARVSDMSLVGVADFFNPSNLLAQAGIVDGPYEPIPIPADVPHVVVKNVDKHSEGGDRLRTAYDALSSGNREVLEAVLSLDVEYSDHISCTRRVGIERVLDSFTGFRNAFGEVRFSDIDAKQFDDYVIVVVTWTGRYTGGLGRPWAVGKTIESTRVDLFHFEDDKVVEIESFGRPDDMYFAMDFERS